LKFSNDDFSPDFKIFHKFKNIFNSK